MSCAVRSWVGIGVALVVWFAVPAQSGDVIGTDTSATLFVVGDVMYRDTSEGAELVGRLLEKHLAGTAGYSRALIVGDLCNDDGAAECYERLERSSWGPLRPLMYAVPGNHDYQEALKIPGSLPYYFYYVLRGSERGRGWFAFNWGGWRVIGLNSEAMAKDADDRLLPVGVQQMMWFERELNQYSRNRCVLTAYHRPMFSSGRFASPAWVAPIFRKSYRHGVDFYVVGHEHFFARMPPLTPMIGPGNLPVVDRDYGVPGIIVGTGGAILFPHPALDPRIRRPERDLKWAQYDEEVLAGEWGITRIDLTPGAYQWKFIPVSPQAGRVYPSGSGRCHDNPPGYTDPPLKQSDVE